MEAQGLVQISGRGRWTADNGDRMHDTYCHPLGVTWDQWQTVHLGRWSVSSCIASLLDTCYIQHRRALGHVRIDASCRMWAHHRVAASSSMQTMLHQLMLAAAMIFPLFTCWELHGCSMHAPPTHQRFCGNAPQGTSRALISRLFSCLCSSAASPARAQTSLQLRRWWTACWLPTPSS